MTAGIWTSRPDREDGTDLRHLAFDDEEIVSRIMFAVRDPLWRTIPMVVTHREEHGRADGFVRRVRASIDDPRTPLDVELHWEAKGRTLRVASFARAHANFDYARIGLNLLLSTAQYAGAGAVLHRGSSHESIVFPRTPVVRREGMDSATAAFHGSFDRCEIAHPSGVRAAIRFGGSLFEFEDQRTWTDRSFKAYSLSDGWPFSATSGDEFRQAIEIEARPGPHVVGHAEASDRLRIEISEPVGALCPVGVSPGAPQAGERRPGGGLAELLASVPPGISVRLPVNGAVHAADPESIGESALVHGEVVRAAKQVVDGEPVVLDPVAFLDVAGDWRDGGGLYTPHIPAAAGRRRWSSPLAGAWAVASVAAAAPAQPAGLFYFGPDLPGDSVARAHLKRLERMLGWAVYPTNVAWPLSAVALGDPTDRARGVLVIANVDREPVQVDALGSDLRIGGFEVVWLPIVCKDPTDTGGWVFAERTRDPLPLSG